MSFDRRLTNLEDSMTTCNGTLFGPANGPLYTVSDFETEDDTQKIVQMLAAMHGQWHQVESTLDDVMRTLPDEQIEAIAAGASIDLSEVANDKLELIAAGHDPERVLDARP